MKTLANCKPTEFLTQTNRIRKAAANWLDATRILEIRKNMPEMVKLTPDMTDEERQAAFDDNKRRSADAMRKNMLDMLESILEEHPSETLELLALVCFIEPENADDHPVGEYLNAISEILRDEAVIGFFTSLALWGNANSKSAFSR